MKLISTSFLEIKKSKFYSYLYQIDFLEEIDTILNIIKNENKKAKHFPYAYIFNGVAKKTDDKEPNGTCGTPIYNVLTRNNLNNHLLIVVRYFGGTKLGVGPLLRSYTKVANDVIK